MRISRKRCDYFPFCLSVRGPHNGVLPQQRRSKKGKNVGALRQMGGPSIIKGNDMPVAEIQSFLKEYFDVLQSQDIEQFDRVFHRGCVLYSAQDGVVVVRPFDEYRKMVQGRESPQSRGFGRADQILMIDVLSPDMALAKVRLRLFDNIMEDYLNLLRVDGKWTIAAKLFHRAETLAG
ncbi:nuclear transport factor 2 family protein [Herbaspirillum sp. NPDC101397]|uniref:nuclear transport factor 2 family protein n=1 Tax=Herbaspirillum sp. NPDC101397 TaxID=3364006 RepID=UPI00383AE9CB